MLHRQGIVESGFLFRCHFFVMLRISWNFAVNIYCGLSMTKKNYQRPYTEMLVLRIHSYLLSPSEGTISEDPADEPAMAPEREDEDTEWGEVTKSLW